MEAEHPGEGCERRERGIKVDGGQHEDSSFEAVLNLNCTASKQVETKAIKCVSFPKNTRDLKQKIENDFSIPVCAQTLRYESTVLSDSDDLRSICLRTGDTLHLTYKSKADCPEVQSVVRWLRSLLDLFQVHVPSLLDTVPSDGEHALNTAIQEGFMEELRNKIFIPWDSDIKQMNKDYFISIGGLDTLVKLYSLLLTQNWHLCPANVQHLELSFPVALYHIASTYRLRRVLIKYGCLELLMDSLLLFKLKRGERVIDSRQNRSLLRDLIGTAMGTLCNMCEIPEAHLKIASRTDVLEQFVSIAHSPSYNTWWAQLAVSAFVCFAHNSEVHQQLASEGMLVGVIDTCKKWKNIGIETADELLLKYFVQLFASQLILVSPHLIPPSLYEKINSHMTRFLTNATVDSISEQESSLGFFWSTFLPYLKLLFVPNTPKNSTTPHNDPSISSLQSLSIESVLFSLQCMLNNPDSRQSFLAEQLNEYVVCVPWHVPQELREKASSFLRVLSTHTQLQPPRLSVLAKTKLAKMQFGLEKMMKMSSLFELLN